MDSKIIGGIVLVCAIVAIAGVIVYNSPSNTFGVINNTINTGNPSIISNNINSTQSSNQLTLTLTSGNQAGSNLSPTPNPTPTPGSGLNQGSNPTLGPLPAQIREGFGPGSRSIPDPMGSIISLFDDYVGSTFLKASEVGLPGSAVVVVKNGKVIYMNCLGVKDVASGSPVNPDTLFLIGSCSKAFTATNIGQLVDKGLMNWNDTITKYYPNSREFQLYDAAATKKLNISNCLTHTSGLPAYAQDHEWYTFNDSYSKMLYNARFVKNTTKLGSTHQYNNIIYALAGYSAARATGKSWGDLIKKELLNPLGMKTATTNLTDYLKSPNHATNYRTYNQNGTIVIKPYFAPGLSNVGPAGSIGASINHMANWLKFQIADTGKFNGQRIISKKNLDATRTGYVYTDNTNTTKYGYGWNVDKDRISHAGDSLSSNTVVVVYADKKIGLAITTNDAYTGMAFMLSAAQKFRDLLNGKKNTDYWPMFSEQYVPKPLPTPVDYKGPGNLNQYTGVYFNAFYGTITIKLKNNTLISYYGNNKQSYTLEHYNNTDFKEEYGLGNWFEFTNLTNGKYQKLEFMAPNYSTVPQNATSTFKRTNSTKS